MLNEVAVDLTRRTCRVGPSARRKRKSWMSFEVVVIRHKTRAVRDHRGLQALGHWQTNLSRNGAINRALFDSLMNNGRRLFSKERAI
jgi:hypothetical protein